MGEELSSSATEHEDEHISSVGERKSHHMREWLWAEGEGFETTLASITAELEAHLQSFHSRQRNLRADKKQALRNSVGLLLSNFAALYARGEEEPSLITPTAKPRGHLSSYKNSASVGLAETLDHLKITGWLHVDASSSHAKKEEGVEGRGKRRATTCQPTRRLKEALKHAGPIAVFERDAPVIVLKRPNGRNWMRSQGAEDGGPDKQDGE